MNLADLIQNFQNAAVAQNASLTQDGLTALQSYLSSHAGKLRLFVARASGFGHQANTVTILRRFIGLGYKNTIQVIYDATPDQESPTTIQKLAVLLPGLDPTDVKPLDIDGVSVEFYAYTDGQAVAALASDPQPLCVNGGNETADNLCSYFNVDQYLQLQPFLWTEGKNLLWQRGGAAATDLTLVPELGKPGEFINRAFYADAPTLEANDWAKLAEVPGIDQEMLGRAKVVVEAVNNASPKAINFLPAYGLYTGSGRNALAGANIDIVVGLIASLATAYTKGYMPQRPTVVSLLTAFTPDGVELWNELVQFFASLNTLSAVKLEDPDFNEKKLLATKKWLFQQKITLPRIQILPSIAAADLTAALRDATPDSILIIALAAPPQPLFNYLYSIANLPPIFEGQGTANYALNLGKPYFQLAKSNVVPYPSLLLADVVKEIPADISTRLLNLQFGVYGVADTTFGSMAELIKQCLLPGSDTANYFASLRTFYHQDQNDKLLMALLYWLHRQPQAIGLSRRAVITAGAATDDDPLQDLYGKLMANTQDGTLNLIPGALAGGTLVEYLLGLAGIPKISVTGVAITQTDTQVEVTGYTTSFAGTALALKLVFTLNADGISLDAAPTLSVGSFQLTGAPWLVLQDAAVAVTVPGNGDRLTGQVSLALALGSQVLALTSNFPTADNQMLLQGTFGDAPPSLEGLLQLLGGVNFARTLPAGLGSLTLQGVQIAYDYTAGAIDSVNVQVQTTQPWKILGKLVLEEIIFNVVVASPATSRQVSWTAASTLRVGTSPTAGTLAIDLAYPNLSLTGKMADDSTPIAVGDLLTFFLTQEVTLNLGASLTSCSLYVVPASDGGTTTLQASALLDTPDWKVTANGVTFALTNLGVDIANDDTGTTGKLTATTSLFTDDPELEVTFDLSANYLGKGEGWQFAGEQTGNDIKVKQILAEYVSADWATAVPDIDVSDLRFEVTAGGGSDNEQASEYSISGKVKVWPTPLGSSGDSRLFKSEITATLGYGTEAAALVAGTGLIGFAETEAGRYGHIKAAVSWYNIDLLLFYDFNPNYKAFGITWGALTGKIEEKQVQGQPHQIASLTFTDSTTLGSMIETCVSWATGAKFGLSAPWNILDEIPLSNLSLIYDFTAKTVSFGVNIGPIELGFARIDSITVNYQSNQPEPADNGVMVQLTGRFLWQSDPGQPLGWDAAKPETTPAPAGQGNKYFDLRLLALGQHVALSGLSSVTQVQDAINLMNSSDLPDPTPGQLPDVTLDPDSSWLVGMDFGVLRLGDDTPKSTAALARGQQPADYADYVLLNDEEPADEPTDAGGYFLTLQIVFNDPNLYALRLALDGAPAKIFKGLDFQILYKKVSDTVGVYMAQIALPDVMRQLKLGTVNITLPIFAIQVYTNGDFLVDIGFPWNQDFSRSLTFQALIITPVGVPIPVMGSAGLYFGKLSSATTDRVPVSTLGTFNPVLVFGFGLQFGIGYSFEAGILKAGFSLTAVAILEGLLARWNPYQLPAGPTDNTQLETAYYYWFRGTVGIVGKLYGSIDFAIIKAELNVDISLVAQLTMAAYAAIQLSITASVDVSLTVTINLGLFKIHISFSFSARISQSITIQGSGAIPPWGAGSGQHLLGRPLRARRLPAFVAVRRLLAAPTLAPTWSHLLKADTPAPLRGYLGLGLTMAGDLATTVADQVACYVSMLFLESVPPPQADSLRCATSALENKSLADTDTSFEKLCKMLFRWVVAAIQPGPLTSAQVDQLPVTDGQLKQLLEYLSDRQNPIPLSYADLGQFLTDQFALTITTSQQASNPDATYFPVPNDLGFAVPAYGSAGAPGSTTALSYSYGDYNALDANYIGQVADYFDALAVLQKEQANSHPLRAATVADAPSMSSFVFSDYFLLLCRQMVQAGRDALRDFKYFLQPGDTPASIVAWTKANGQPGYAVAELFGDNATVALSAQAGSLAIASSHYLTQAGDTFASIAQQARYGSGFDKSGTALALLNSEVANLLQPGSTVQYPGQAVYVVLPGQSLAEVAKQLGQGGVTVADLLAKSNVLTLANLLLPVVSLAVPTFSYTISSGDTLRSIASQFGIAVDALAGPAANAAITDLFDAAVKTIDLVELGEFNVGAILQEVQATQGLQHLSGMTSRYYLAGLRLPTAGITPRHAGMWVQQPALTLPPMAGLYALTGQQFPLPVLTAGNPLDITFTSAASWLQFDGSTPQQTVISVVPGEQTARELASVQGYAMKNVLEVGTTFLGAGDAFKSKPATYPFTSAIIWNAAAPVNMPYDGAPAGLPSLKLWQLPDTLLQLPASKRAINPKVELLSGHFNSATGAMDDTPVQHYGYATVVEFTIKKIPAFAPSPATKTTYEIVGADGTNAEILEKIVAGVGQNDAAIASLSIAYAVGANAATPQGIQTDAPQFLTFGIAQVNLSTETHPGQAAARLLAADDTQAPSGPQLLNTPTSLITLLWEASITRSGGFYLYYYNAENSGGLPDSIFNSNQEATLRLVVLYAQPADATQQNRIPDYLNALATAEALDTANAVLYAKAAPDPTTLTLAAGQTWTLAQLAYAYFSNVADVAAGNQTQPLKTNAALSITEGVYEVGPAGAAGDLAAIAAYFGTTPDAIKAANPLRQDWPTPLPLFTSLRLPALTITVGTSPGGTSLASLASYYGQNLAALAAHNQDVAGIFADGTPVQLAGGPLVRSSTVPAGTVALQAVRPVPPPVPADPADPDFGACFLQHNFSLLGYQVLDNEAFRASPVGLPAGPTSPPMAGHDKIRAPRKQSLGDNWVYRQSVPYSRFAKHSTQAVEGMPDPAVSPYQGLGSILKVDFNWQDYYGNVLLTTLRQPNESTAVLNQPPVLTGYTDPLLGLNQWPAVGSSWQVGPSTIDQTPQLDVQLSFDDSPYQGLNQVVAQSSQVVVAYFTLPLDPKTANVTANYALAQQDGPGLTIKVLTAVLNPDNTSVRLTVEPLVQSDTQALTLTIGNLLSADPDRNEQLTFSGVATFYYASETLPGTTPVTDSATRDQQLYQQLWYQLNDPNGIALSVVTDLLKAPNVLSANQTAELLNNWLAPLYLFLSDRAAGHTTVIPPAATHDICFPIDLTQLNDDQIFRLNLTFCIERTGGAVAGDFETTGGVKQVSTAVAPLMRENGSTAGFDAFAQQFEQAIQVPGHFKILVASGIDRTQNNRNASDQALWAVRHAADTGIGYEINNVGKPELFAPAPIFNQLESRTQVPIFDFNPQTGINFATPTRQLDFAAIDLDQWGRQFFTAIDQVLSPEYTAAIQLIDYHLAGSYYAQILAYKNKLADIVKDWLIPVFQDANPGSLDAVRESFRQLLLVQLGNAYTTSAAVQFAATVAAEVPADIAPRLYGALQANFRFLGAVLNPDDATRVDLFFSSEVDDTAAGNALNYSAGSELQIQTATLDLTNRRRVMLKLSNNAVPGTTQLTILPSFVSSSGSPLLLPLTQPVATSIVTDNYSDSITLTSAKLALAPAAAQLLAFLVTAPQVVKDAEGAVIPFLDLDLTFAGNQLEHQLANPIAGSDYQASSWLSFLTPAGNQAFGANLGKFSVPLVLRTFPLAPALLFQQGKGAGEEADSTTLLNWDYGITYAEAFHFPQDKLSFTVNFNVQDTLLRADYSMGDAFGALAEFVTVFPQVAPVLTSALASIDANSTSAQLTAGAVALNAFNGLVGYVVTQASSPQGLRLRARPARRTSTAVPPYQFDLRESKATIIDAGSSVEALLVILIPASGTTAPDGITPTVELDDCTTFPYDQAEPGTYAYYFRSNEGKKPIITAAEGQQKAQRTVKLCNLNILQRQDAETTVELKRNVELIPGRPSAEAFVYTTGTVGFPDTFHPTIINSQPIDISTLGTSVPNPHNTLPLVQQLTNLLDFLLLENTQPLLYFQMSCSYEYQMATGLSEIVLPVLMQPLTLVQVQEPAPADGSADITRAQLIAGWAGGITNWYQHYQPSTAQAGFTFDLTLFSNLTQQPFPLLRLTALTLPIIYIERL